MNIKPIETAYKGYKFRSRLEARWAVFFDALGGEWQYEPEGYDLGELGWYLPDFHLPKMGLWVEIKPEVVEQSDIAKVETFGYRHPIAMLRGYPGIRGVYASYLYEGRGTSLADLGVWAECGECGKAFFGAGFSGWFEGFAHCQHIHETGNRVYDGPRVVAGMKAARSARFGIDRGRTP
jgi:hypothetical protein